MILEITFILLITLYMGFFSRVTGGGFVDLPLSLENWLYALPYGVLSYLAVSLSFSLDLTYEILSGLVGFAGAYMGKRTGHGQYMDLATWKRTIEPEKLDFIVKLFFGEDRNVAQTGKGDYWRDVFGCVVVGIAVPFIPTIILMASGMYFLGFLLILGGAAKGLAYMFGWWVYPEYPRGDPQGLSSPTHLGEFFTGIFAGIPLGYALVQLLGI